MRRQWFLVGMLAFASCTTEVPDVQRSELAADSMTRVDFEGYLKALQAHDYDGFAAYYTDDFKAHIHLPTGETTYDRAGVIELERAIAAQVAWTMDVLDLVIGDAAIVLHARQYGPILKELPDGRTVGDQVESRYLVLYTLRGKKIAELRLVAYQT